MKNFRQEIDMPRDFVAPTGGVTSGVPLLVGGEVVVPQEDALVGVMYAAKTSGIFSLPKASGFTIAIGDPVYFDFTTDKRVESSGTLIGRAAKPDEGTSYGSSDTRVNVAIGGADASQGGGVVFAQGISSEDDSTGTTAGTTETPFTNVVTIPANLLRAGDRIRLYAKVRCTSDNSTNTLALAAALAASAATLAASTLNWSTVAAVDAAAGDSWQMEAELRVTAIGAASTATFQGTGRSWKNGATPAFLGTDVNDNTTVATTAAIVAGVTYTWSASSASNVARIKELFVEVIRPTSL